VYISSLPRSVGGRVTAITAGSPVWTCHGRMMGQMHAREEPTSHEMRKTRDGHVHMYMYMLIVIVVDGMLGTPCLCLHTSRLAQGLRLRLA